MDSLLDYILKGVIVRGTIFNDHSLSLYCLTGFYFSTGATEGKGEPRVFEVKCKYESDGNPYGFYSNKPKLSLQEYNPSANLLEVRERWDIVDYSLDTTNPLEISSNNISHYPGNHLQVVETLACLCVHLSQARVRNDAFAKEIYAILADRIDGLITGKNREYIKTMEMDPLY